jgi:hypothetical protein
MLLPRPARVVFRVAIVVAGAIALSQCSAEDPSGNGGMGPRAMFGTPGGSGGSAAGAPASGTAGSASGGTDPFGNPTGGIPPEAPPTVGGTSGCLEATVSFVVDGSGSMCDAFGTSTRWQELRTALLAPSTGLIHRLQTQAAFGMTIYDGSIDIGLAGMAAGSPAPDCAGASSAGRLNATECMQLVEVPPALTNAAAIDAAFPMRELGGSTPTDRALNQTVDALIAAQAGVDLMLHPQFIILATDGQPNDICAGGAGGDGSIQRMNVLTAVDRAYAATIKTYVISLAGADAALQMHLDEVARHGNPADPAAHTFTPTNPEELVSALTQVLGNALGCNVM